MHKYVLYGLGIHSEIPLWGPPVEDCPADVRIEWRSGEIDSSGEAGSYISELDDDGTVRFRWPSIASMSIRNGQEILVETPELNHARHLIAGAGLGLILHQRGIFTLHASTVAIGAHAIGVAGAKRSGKSTTAAVLSSRGHTLLSDDVLALDILEEGAIRVLPGPSTLNLWPDTATAVGQDPERLPLIWPRSTKRISIVPNEAQREGFPLKCIFFLEVSGDDLVPTIDRYPPFEAMSLLIGHSHALRIVQDKRSMPQHLLQCATVAQQVDLFRLRRPGAVDSIQEVARLIEDEVAKRYALAGLASRN